MPLQGRNMGETLKQHSTSIARVLGSIPSQATTHRFFGTPSERLPKSICTGWTNSISPAHQGDDGWVMGSIGYHDAHTPHHMHTHTTQHPYLTLYFTRYQLLTQIVQVGDDGRTRGRIRPKRRLLRLFGVWYVFFSSSCFIILLLTLLFYFRYHNTLHISDTPRRT